MFISKIFFPEIILNFFSRLNREAKQKKLPQTISKLALEQKSVSKVETIPVRCRDSLANSKTPNNNCQKGVDSLAGFDFISLGHFMTFITSGWVRLG